MPGWRSGYPHGIPSLRRYLWLLSFVACLLTQAQAQVSTQPDPDGDSEIAKVERLSWQIQRLPASDPARQIQALWRSSGAAAYRLIVVPGSGCAGMGPVASRYFEQLQHAEIWILHKPYVQPWRAVTPDACGAEFIQYDRLTRWQTDASHALEAIFQRQPSMPVVLLGISEGAEILPALARQVGSSLRGLLLLSASGLDPAEAFRMQLQATGHASVLSRLESHAASDLSDAQVINGRSMGYWRDMLTWSVQRPLLELRQEVLQIWGDGDEQIPARAYLTFRNRSDGWPVRLCSWVWPGASHGLRTLQGQQLQSLVWPVLEDWLLRGRLQCPSDHTVRRQ